jgi:hypothetical protein
MDLLHLTLYLSCNIKNEEFIIAIYVANITLYSPRVAMIKTVMITLKFEYVVTDLGNCHWLPEIQIKFGPKRIELKQSILLRVSLQDYVLTCLPHDCGTTLTRSNFENGVNDIKSSQS